MPTQQHLPPSRRALAARIAANERWSREDGRAGTEKARRAGPGRIEYWLTKVDPAEQLAPAERQRRAEAAKRAYFSRLSLRAAQAREARRHGAA